MPKPLDTVTGYYSEEFACIVSILRRNCPLDRGKSVSFLQWKTILYCNNHIPRRCPWGWVLITAHKWELNCPSLSQGKGSHATCIHPWAISLWRDYFSALCLTFVLTEVIPLEQECPWMASAVFCFHRINCPVWESLVGKSQLQHRSSSLCLLFPCTQPQTTLKSPLPCEVVPFVCIHWETMMQGFSSHELSTASGISPTQFNMFEFIRRNR